MDGYEDPHEIWRENSGRERRHGQGSKATRSRMNLPQGCGNESAGASPSLREASRSRASDSPAPGESRMLEQPGQTKNTEEFDDRLEVERVVALGHCGTLGAAVGEELLLGSVPGPRHPGQPKGCSKRLLPF